MRYVGCRRGRAYPSQRSAARVAGANVRMPGVAFTPRSAVTKLRKRRRVLGAHGLMPRGAVVIRADRAQSRKAELPTSCSRLKNAVSARRKQRPCRGAIVAGRRRATARRRPLRASRSLAALAADGASRGGAHAQPGAVRRLAGLRSCCKGWYPRRDDRVLGNRRLRACRARRAMGAMVGAGERGLAWHALARRRSAPDIPRCA